MGMISALRKAKAEARAVDFGDGLPDTYTGQQLLLQAGLVTGSLGQSQRLAAVEAGAGLICRAVASGKVEAGRFTPLITWRLLSGIVRGLVYSGEQAVWLSPSRTGVFPLSLSLVRHNWIASDLLQVEELMPHESRWHAVSPAEVAIPVWATNPREPWRGISPLYTLTTELGEAATSMLLRECRSKHGYMLYSQASPSFGGKDSGEATAELARQTEAKFGGLADYKAGGLHGHAQAQGTLGRSANQLGQQTRFGADPPMELRNIVEYTCLDTLRALGVPPLLLASNTSTDRQVLRNFVSVTCQPLADGIAQELGRVLETPVTLDLSPVRAADDLVSRGRAVGSLVAAGVDEDEAMRIAGLREAE